MGSLGWVEIRPFLNLITAAGSPSGPSLSNSQGIVLLLCCCYASLFGFGNDFSMICSYQEEKWDVAYQNQVNSTVKKMEKVMALHRFGCLVCRKSSTQ